MNFFLQILSIAKCLTFGGILRPSVLEIAPVLITNIKSIILWQVHTERKLTVRIPNSIGRSFLVAYNRMPEFSTTSIIYSIIRYLLSIRIVL